MSLFSYFSKDERQKRAVAGAVAKANSKHMPKDYRRAALSQVIETARQGDTSAINGLVARFSVFAEPSIEDEEEKEWIHEELVQIGKPALPALFKAVEGGAESISFHLRTLEHILSEAEYNEKLLEIINKFDTEYERNPDRKIQLIVAIGDRNDPRIPKAIVRFLEDVDETVRFNAVKALARHRDEESCREPFIRLLLRDESQRVKDELVEILGELQWSVHGYRKEVEAALPSGCRLDRQGTIKKAPKR